MEDIPKFIICLAERSEIYTWGFITNFIVRDSGYHHDVNHAIEEFPMHWLVVSKISLREDMVEIVLVVAREYAIKGYAPAIQQILWISVGVQRKHCFHEGVSQIVSLGDKIIFQCSPID